jgi:hypothetical protein
MDTEPQTKIFSFNDFRKSIFLFYCATSDLQSNIIFSKWTQEMLAVSNTSSVLAVCNDNVYLLYAAKQTTKTCLTLHCWWETYCELRNEQRGQDFSNTGCNLKEYSGHCSCTLYVWWILQTALTPNNFPSSTTTNNYVQSVTSSQEHTKKNSVALVCERTIPTERPLLVDEVSANFCG